MSEPVTFDQPFSNRPDLEFIWAGYKYFWDRELRQLEAPGQAARYAQEWGIPPWLPVVAGAGIIEDINSLVNAVVGIISEAAGYVAHFLQQVATLPNRIFSIIDQTFYQPIRDISGAVWNLVSSLWNLVGNAGGWFFGAAFDVGQWVFNAGNAVGNAVVNAGSYVANTLWGIINWAGEKVAFGLGFVGNQVWGIISWLGGVIGPPILSAGNAVYNGITWAANTIGAGVNSVANAVWNQIAWAATQLYNGLIYAATQAWVGLQSLGGWLYPWLRKVFVDLAADVFLPVADTIADKLMIPIRFYRGDYDSPGELLDDLLHTFPVASFLGGMIVPVVVGSFVGALVSGTAAPQFEEWTQPIAARVGATLPPAAATRDAYLRGAISEAEHDQLLSFAGFSASRIAWMKSLYRLEPTPTDLIRFLVREVFSPDVRQRFGQDADFPSQAEAEGRKIGLFGEVLRNYWAAHWELPATGQGFQMFHRGVLDRADLDLLLRAKDVMPFWRERLVQIAFNPPGRIDLRRMFAAGVINEARVLRGYLDIGYNPEDARALTDFAVRAAAGNPPELPRSTITAAYGDGLLDRGQAAFELNALGFAADDVELFLDLEDLNLARELANLEEDVIEADFKAGSIDEGSARAQLRSLGVPEQRVDLLLRRWANRKAVRTVTLSAAQVQRLYREGILAEASARGRFDALGYNRDDADLLLELARPDVAESEPAELTVAQLRQAYTRGLFDERELRERLERRGYRPEDVTLLLQLSVPEEPGAEAAELTKADIRALLRANLIDRVEAEGRLHEKGFAPADVDLLIAWWTGA